MWTSGDLIRSLIRQVLFWPRSKVLSLVSPYLWWGGGAGGGVEESSQKPFLTSLGWGVGEGKGKSEIGNSLPTTREFKASLWFVLRAVFIYERGNVRLNNVT